MVTNVDIKIEKRICVVESIAKEIGLKLQSKRIDRGISIEEVHNEARIPLRYLHAMESGNFAQLPAEVYLIGSLRKYAQYLGLDANELINIYNDKSKLPISDCEDPSKKETKFDFALLSVVLIIVLGIIIAFVFALSKSKNIEIKSKNTAPNPAVESVVEVQPAKQVKPAAPVIHKTAGIIPQNLTKKELTVEITTSDTSWIKIISDDKPVFEGVLPPQSQRTWSAASNLSIKIGYVPAVASVRLNGKEIDIINGSQQDVNTLNLSWDDLE